MARLWDLVHPWLPFNFWAVTERRKGNTGIKYLAEQHNRMALVGLRNKNVSISSPTRLPWGIPHRRRGRLIKNQREKSVILQLKLTQAKLESFTCTPKQDNERPRPIHILSPSPLLGCFYGCYSQSILERSAFMKREFVFWSGELFQIVKGSMNVN